MSGRMWRRLLWLAGCEVADPLETYETTQRWVTYTYPYSDRALDWFGRSFVLCTCCVCGEREYVQLRAPTAWLRKAPTMPDQGAHPLRKRFLADHWHPGVNRNPLSWELPLRNPAVLRDGDLEDVLGVAVARARRAAPTTEPARPGTPKEPSVAEIEEPESGQGHGAR